MSAETGVIQFDTVMAEAMRSADPFRTIAGPPERGDCFVVAYRLAVGCYALEVAGQLQGRNVELVHGIPLGTAGNTLGLRFAHAWVEMIHPDVGPIVMDYSSGHDLRCKRTAYYRAGTIDPGQCVRYDPELAVEFADEWNDLGPWEAPVSSALLFDSNGVGVPAEDNFTVGL